MLFLYNNVGKHSDCMLFAHVQEASNIRIYSMSECAAANQRLINNADLDPNIVFRHS